MNESLYPLGVPPNAWYVNESTADLTRSRISAQIITLETATKTLRIDLNKSALVIIDMQNDFCHPDGWLAHIGVDVTPARSPIVPIQQALPILRKAGLSIVWVNWGNRPDLLNISPATRYVYNPDGQSVGLGDPLPTNQAPVLEKESWAAAIVDELQPVAGDIKIDKYRMSGFWDTSLDSILRNLGKTTLFFAGVNADQCVMTTLQDANFLGYDCILLEDCTATTSPEFCWQATLYNVKQCFGFVSSSNYLLDSIKSNQKATS